MMKLLRLVACPGLLGDEGAMGRIARALADLPFCRLIWLGNCGELPDAVVLGPLRDIMQSGKVVFCWGTRVSDEARAQLDADRLIIADLGSAVTMKKGLGKTQAQPGVKGITFW